jgi:hypothetical protein
MALSGALMLALALVAGAGDERLLLCRPRVIGDPALARAEAVAQAAKSARRLLDYGVVCDDVAESARAARRAGLAHAISGTADGRGEGSRYELVLADVETEAVRATRTVEVPPGADAVRPVRDALGQLVSSLPRGPGPRPAHVAAWAVAGAGVVALAAGTVVAFRARDAADRANGAADPAAYTSAREQWRDRRRTSGVLLGAGGAALAAGLTWRFAF